MNRGGGGKRKPRASLAGPEAAFPARFVRLVMPIVLGPILLGAACGHEPTQPGQGGVRERWFQSQTKGFPHPRPVVSGSNVYFASGGGLVIARDLTNGKVQWATPIGSTPNSASTDIRGSNFVLSNGVIVTAVQFHTTGLDAATGRELWRYEAPLDTIDKVSPRPGFVEKARIAADDNTVFVPAWGATVSAVDLKTGQARWVWRVDSTLPFRSGSMGVKLSGDTLFATVWHSLNQSGTIAEAWLLALNKLDGRELWHMVLPRESSGTVVQVAPAVWGNLVFVTLGSGDLFAVDRTTQKVAWHIPTQLPSSGFGFAVITGPEVFGDVVYANGSDVKLHAYRASDGTQLWESDAGQFDNDLLITDKFVYASDGTGLFIFDRVTGARYADLGHPRKAIDYIFSSAAAVFNGQIFVTLSDGAWSFDEP
jgi:outer membrane protein assembly factor BamB